MPMQADQILPACLSSNMPDACALYLYALSGVMLFTVEERMLEKANTMDDGMIL